MDLKKYLRNMSIKSKMYLYIGLSVALIMLISFGFFIASLRANTKEDAVRIAEELVKGYSNQMLRITNTAMGFSESLASTSNYMVNGHSALKDSILKDALINSAKNNKNFKCIWISLDYSALTPGYDKASGRKNFLTIPNSSTPLMVVDKDMDSYDPSSLYYLVRDTRKSSIKEPYMYNYYNNSDQQYVTTIAYPIVSKGKGVGVAGVDVGMEEFQKVIEKIDIYPNAKSFLVSAKGTVVASSEKKLIGKSFDDYMGGNAEEIDIAKVLQNDDFFQGYVKNDGTKYLTIVVPFQIGDQGVRWALGTMVPTSEIFANSSSRQLLAVLVCIIGIIVMVVIVNFLARRITKPIQDVTNSIKRLSGGEIDDTEKLDIKTGDELEEIADSLNVLVDGLNQTAEFAQKIGEGDLEASHHLLSDRDLLGKSLEDMRKSLIIANEKEIERKKEEEKSNWSNQGAAKFADLLRMNNDNIKELSFSVVSSLVKYLEINQGGMFLLDDTDENHPVLSMSACFAYNRRKLTEKQFEIGEGLVGRCYVEAETIYMLDIPDDYISITSGLGDTNPSCLVLVPLKLNNEINGVIELASLKPIEDYKVKFVEKVAESIASTISSVKINVHTAELLNQTRQQAEEMSAQEEEMRQNLEELQSTQEEMVRVQEEQKAAQDALFFEKSLFTNFLDNVPEVIYFKDLQSKMLRVSKSMTKAHNMPIEEIIGKTDFDLFGYGEHSQQAFNDEQEIIRTGKPVFNMLEREDHEDGRITWVTTNKMPLRDLKGNIIGTFGISKDCTEIMKLQENLNVERSLFSNFMDGSQDYIYFKDKEGKFVRVNKRKYEKDGFTSEKEMIGKTDLDIFGEEYNKETRREEQKIMDTGVPIIGQVQHVKNPDGSMKWVEVSKMPFVDAEGNIIGIWGITRDILNKKELEDKIAKNEKKNETVEGKGGVDMN